MSTSYYGLHKPITHLRVESSNQGHTKLAIWIDHGHAGTLTIPTQSLGDVLFLLFDCDKHPPLRTHWGGEYGAIVTVCDKDMPDEAVLISEYGKLLTVGQVKARDGAKRLDGMPTELFGYEVVE